MNIFIHTHIHTKYLTIAQNCFLYQSIKLCLSHWSLIVSMVTNALQSGECRKKLGRGLKNNTIYVHK